MTQPPRHYAYIEAAFDSIRRGGSTRIAACFCGWRDPERRTLELAADDALMHEKATTTERRRRE